MKIDIHTHTRKCKSGDAPTREINPEDFCETVRSTDVGIIAITNHNVFDIVQFTEIVDLIAGDVQVWPGIELDVIEEGTRGHLLVIVSPSKASEFAETISLITARSTPDNFTTTIDQVIEELDSLGPIYVAHYKQKKPNLSDEAIDRLIAATANPARVLKEVANSISAGIFISHGHPSIYGSDVNDWAKYEEDSRDLPDLRLPVESFEHFCLLLEKDPTTINTVLNKKIAENLLLTPFEDSTLLKLTVFNDINIVFGPKGTGKSCILEAIAKYYNQNGVDAEVYLSTSDRLDQTFDIKGKDVSINLRTYGIEYCKDEVQSLREAKEVGVTGLSKYVNFFGTKSTSRNAKKIKIKDLEPEGEGASKREFNEFHEAVERTSEFLG